METLNRRLLDPQPMEALHRRLLDPRECLDREHLVIEDLLLVAASCHHILGGGLRDPVTIVVLVVLRHEGELGQACIRLRKNRVHLVDGLLH